MVLMFAPYCPTCARRVLLGPRRIVAADLSAKPFTVSLRCFCDTVVAADNPLPVRPIGGRPAEPSGHLSVDATGPPTAA